MNVTTRAGLAGIGAVFLTSAVLTGITVELWFLRIVVTDGPPPRIDELLVLKWFAGSLVAARLGGVRAVGTLGLYALGVVSLTIFRLVIEAPLQCALVSRPNCSTNLLAWITGTPWVLEGSGGSSGSSLACSSARSRRGRSARPSRSCQGSRR